MNVSDPRSTGYGKHWSPDQIRDAFRPSEESIAIVTEWLRSAGIHHSTERKGWLEFEASVQEAEDMLKSTYYEHADDRTGGIKIGCQECFPPSKCPLWTALTGAGTLFLETSPNM